MKVINLETGLRVEFIDITGQVQSTVAESGVEFGLCVVFVPHTTAAVTINENADPAVTEDIIGKLSQMVPHNERYRHLEGNSDAHIKSSLVGCSQEIVIENNKLHLGTWQAIFFCEFDGPRHRRYGVKTISC